MDRLSKNDKWIIEEDLDIKKIRDYLKGQIKACEEASIEGFILKYEASEGIKILRDVPLPLLTMTMNDVIMDPAYMLDPAEETMILERSKACAL